MPFKALLTKEEHGALDAGIRGYYKESERGFVLDVEPVGDFGLSDATPLKNAVRDEREAKKALEAKLKRFKRFEDEGIDPEEALGAHAKLKGLGDDADVGKRIEAAVSEAKVGLQRKYDSDLAKAKDRERALLTKTSRHFARGAVLAAIGEHKGRSKLLLPAIIERVRVVEEDGDEGGFRIEVLGEDGKAMLTQKPGSTSLMSPSEYVSLLAKDPEWGGAFEAPDAHGTRSPTGKVTTPTTGGVTKITRDDIANGRYDAAKMEKGEYVIEG